MIAIFLPQSQEMLFTGLCFQTPEFSFFLVLIRILPHGLLKSLLCSVFLAALELRLKDGAHSCEGRVEVKHQGEWGTVNDQNWSLEEAAVVCRQLGCGAAINASRGVHFGPGIGPIWFQYIYCNGTESSLMECSYPPLKNHLPEGLSHDRDAGAVCLGKSCQVWEGIFSWKSLCLFLRIAYAYGSVFSTFLGEDSSHRVIS